MPRIPRQKQGESGREYRNRLINETGLRYVDDIEIDYTIDDQNVKDSYNPWKRSEQVNEYDFSSFTGVKPRVSFEEYPDIDLNINEPNFEDDQDVFGESTNPFENDDQYSSDFQNPNFDDFVRPSQEQEQKWHSDSDLQHMYEQNQIINQKNSTIEALTSIKRPSTNYAQLGEGDSEEKFTYRSSDYITDIFASSSTFLLASINVNIGLPECFPKASQIAGCFSYYKMKKLRFIYTSTSGDQQSVSSSSLGYISMGQDVPDRNPFTTKQEMQNHYNVVTSSPNKSFFIDIDCNNIPTDKLYIRTNPLENKTADLRLSDVCTLYVATGNSLGNNLVGELSVEYEVELYSTKLSSVALGKSHWFWYSTLKWSTNQPITAFPSDLVTSANAADQTVGRYVAGNMEMTSNGEYSVAKFPPYIPVGTTFLVIYNYAHNSGTTPGTVPLSFTSSTTLASVASGSFGITNLPFMTATSSTGPSSLQISAPLLTPGPFAGSIKGNVNGIGSSAQNNTYVSINMIRITALNAKIKYNLSWSPGGFWFGGSFYIVQVPSDFTYIVT